MRAAGFLLRQLAAFGLAASATTFAGEVRVAVAANFTLPAQSIARAFEQETGHKAQLAFGSTGRFFAQIANGAPFDVLLAADGETPQQLERQGLAVAGSGFTYAVGRLVLWSRNPALVDAKGDVLQGGNFPRIAIADPKLAPYGAAALQTLNRLGLLSRLQPKFVQGESIAQTYQFVASENAPLGFVALSQVFAEGRLTQGSAWVVPQDLHQPILQDAVLLTKGRTNAAAAAFLVYLRSPKSRDTIRSFGYDLCSSQASCRLAPGGSR